MGESEFRRMEGVREVAVQYFASATVLQTPRFCTLPFASDIPKLNYRLDGALTSLN